MFCRHDARTTAGILDDITERRPVPPALPLLILSFALYLLPSVLPAFFYASSRLLLPANRSVPGTVAGEFQSLLENLLAFGFFGMQLLFLPGYTKKAGNLLARFALSLGILGACGIFAAWFNKLTIAGNMASLPMSASVGQEVRSTWLGLLLLGINTSLAAFKEELIYRAVPGTILAYLFGLQTTFAQIQAESPVKSIGETSPKRTRQQKLAISAALLVFSIPFALAHQGPGTIAASLILGTSFLFLVLRGWSWLVLALAHTAYNLAVLLLRF